MKLNVQFNEQQTAVLAQLAHEVGTTKARILKMALALLQVALQEREQGNAIAVVRDGEVVKAIVLT